VGFNYSETLIYFSFNSYHYKTNYFITHLLVT